MRSILNPKNQELEKQLREKIKVACLAKAHEFDPYSVSKVLRYLYEYNDGNALAVKTYEALGLQFLTNLKARKESLKEMTFDDPLIDIQIKDIIDIVRIYSVYSKHEQHLFVPQLFMQETSG